ncbi:MAG: hypothetical protein IRZ21_08395 [Thermoleophilaceae bacterium]|nr:hypothetical protein [Thermoleophilaceae bacterium]
MCHSRRYRDEWRDERFDEELRHLMDRERERPRRETPVVERESGADPVAEREPAPATRR